MEQLEISNIGGGNAKWYSNFKKTTLTVSYKVKYALSILLVPNLLLKCLSLPQWFEVPPLSYARFLYAVELLSGWKQLFCWSS